MSHGGGGYSVVENQQRLERQRQAALERARRLLRALDELRGTAKALAKQGRKVARVVGDVPSFPAGTASLAEIEAWCRAVDQVLDDARDDVGRAVAEARAADLSAHLRRVVASGPLAERYRPSADAARSAGGGGPARGVPSVDELVAAAEPVLARLDGDVPAEVVDELRSRVEGIDLVARVGLDTWLTDLKARVQAANRQARERRQERERAEALLRRLEGIAGVEADDLRQLLERVVAGSTRLVGVDAHRVEAVRARAIAEEDRRYVAEQLRAAFVELGYEVDASFVDDLTAGSAGLAFLPGGGPHAAAIELDDDRYAFHLVRADPAGIPDVDTAKQRQLCADMAKVVGGRVPLDGAHLDLTEHHDAGDPVPYSERAAARRRARTSERSAARPPRSRRAP